MQKFKYLDILTMIDGDNYYYVIDFNNGYYYIDDARGYCSTLSKEYCEKHFRKIGEVTRDVLRGLNPRIRA